MSPAIPDTRIEDLERRIEHLSGEVRRLSRMVVILDHDLAVRRLEERVPFRERLGRRLRDLLRFTRRMIWPAG